MSSIKFITDQRNGEPDVLPGNRVKPLVVRSCWDQRDLIQVLPSGPWTHQSLQNLGDGLTAMFADVFLIEGADAFLGEQWVGSTEV